MKERRWRKSEKEEEKRRKRRRSELLVAGFPCDKGKYEGL